MADPITEVTQAPKARSRAQQFGRKGIPKDPNRAHARVRAARAVRRKPNPKAVLSGTFPKSLVDVVLEMSDHFEVSRSDVLKKFIENGILDYGTPEQIAAADIKQGNPFTSMPERESSQPTTELRSQPSVDAIHFTGVEEYRPKPPPVLGIAAGPPLGFAPPDRADISTTIEDEEEDGE